ncbi:MAG TPA: cyclase family protein [Candidatus Dormibacteraeota bacterium]|nr:cyclase family protein [Candidatus Dormibacteraeota bacterium]
MLNPGIAGAVGAARVFDLEQPRYAGAPSHPAHAPGFNYFLHRHHARGGPEARTGASGLVVMPEHSGTHIDALCHQAENLTLHGGVHVDTGVQTSVGFRVLGIETMAPLVGRGVLLDVAANQRLPPSHEITAEELKQAAANADVEIRAGDVVLVRTGYGALWSDPSEYLRSAGVSAAGSRWLIDRKVGAVGADNMAWDVIGPTDPELGVTLPGHVLLLVRAGIPIIENLNLEELAAAKIHEFGFICLPLKMRGATGSPVRPIALA